MPVQITIRGRKYTLRSDDSEGDLTAVAAYVERKMGEIPRSGVDEYTIALLAALNIASEFHRHRRAATDALALVERELAAVGAVLESALPEAEGGEE